MDWDRPMEKCNIKKRKNHKTFGKLMRKFNLLKFSSHQGKQVWKKRQRKKRREGRKKTTRTEEERRDVMDKGVRRKPSTSSMSF